MRFPASLLVAACATFVATAALGQTPAPMIQGKECRDPVSGTASAQPAREVGEAAAIAVWAARTSAEFYPVFANWTNAEARTVACEIYTSAIGFNLWRCTAQAIPCRIP